jgi:hypothetical protein
MRSSTPNAGKQTPETGHRSVANTTDAAVRLRLTNRVLSLAQNVAAQKGFNVWKDAQSNWPTYRPDGTEIDP